MSHTPQTLPATDMVRGYKDAQSGMMYEFRETELWRKGWMIWFDRQSIPMQPAWPCPASMRCQHDRHARLD